MSNWKHELKLKDLWQDRSGDHDEQARQVAPVVAERVMALSKRLATKDPSLAMDLEEVADGFECVAEEEGEDASETFNVFLRDLYDLGDRHRIWIG